VKATAFSTLFCVPGRPELLHIPSGTLAHGAPSRVLKQGKGTTVTLLSLPTGAVVVKHYRATSWRRRADTVLHGSPARRAWRGAQLLPAWGFLVPRPLAAFERRGAGVVWESIYVSEGLLTQIPLNVYWCTRSHQWSRRQKSTFLRALAGFVRALHERGLYLGDLKDENLLVEESHVSQWRFYLVDLDRVRRFSSLTQRRRLKNLVQLERTLGHNARLSERLAFLYAYFGDPVPPRAQRRAFLRRLVRLRIRKDREYARRRARRPRLLSRAAVKRREVQAALLQPDPSRGREPISCCIICFNEAANIRRCLESVKWCDEIVVVDSFSTDQTVAICREYTTRILQRPWPGYVEQKRFALAQASYEWVLNVDADEEVSPELQREIIEVLRRNDPAVDGFYIPRLVYYLGRWWWHGWYPGYRLRLFRKAKVRWGGINPHEKVLLRGHADRLHGDLYHYTYEDIADHLQALDTLTEVASRELLQRGQRVRTADLLLRPFWRFLRFYLLRGCIREGVPGFFVAVTSAFYVFLKYAKVWEGTTRVQYAAQTQDSPRQPGDAVGWG
jgi:hypothetical protein